MNVPARDRHVPRAHRSRNFQHRSSTATGGSRFSGIVIVLSLLGLIFSGLNLLDRLRGRRADLRTRSHGGHRPRRDRRAAPERTTAALGEVQIVNGDTVVDPHDRRSRRIGTDPTTLLKALAKQAGIDRHGHQPAGRRSHVGDGDLEEGAARADRRARRDHALHRVPVRVEDGGRAPSIALVHDVIITAGVYALTGRVVTPATVIAILTILGFSLYDTVVIYDKIKENTETSAMVSRAGIRGTVMDLSLNQVVHALGEHLARRAAADPVAAVVRRRHAEGLRVRDVRRRRDRGVLVDLHRGAVLVILKGREKRQLEPAATGRRAGLARRARGRPEVARPTGPRRRSRSRRRGAARDRGHAARGPRAPVRSRSGSPPAKQQRR